MNPAATPQCRTPSKTGSRRLRLASIRKNHRFAFQLVPAWPLARRGGEIASLSAERLNSGRQVRSSGRLNDTASLPRIPPDLRCRHYHHVTCCFALLGKQFLISAGMAAPTVCPWYHLVHRKGRTRQMLSTTQHRGCRTRGPMLYPQSPITQRTQNEASVKPASTNDTGTQVNKTHSASVQ